MNNFDVKIGMIFMRCVAGKNEYWKVTSDEPHILFGTHYYAAIRCSEHGLEYKSTNRFSFQLIRRDFTGRIVPPGTKVSTNGKEVGIKKRRISYLEKQIAKMQKELDKLKQEI